MLKSLDKERGYALFSLCRSLIDIAGIYLLPSARNQEPFPLDQDSPSSFAEMESRLKILGTTSITKFGKLKKEEFTNGPRYKRRLAK